MSVENVIVRIEPINTSVLKSKYFDVKSDQGDLSSDFSKGYLRWKNPPTYSAVVKYTCFQIRNLRLRVTNRETVNQIRRVWFDLAYGYCFYNKDDAESEAKCEFKEIDGCFILHLEPFGPVGNEVLVRAVYFTHHVFIEVEQQLRENEIFLEWDECNISKDNVALFNQKYPDSPTDFWSLSSSVTTQLITFTDLSPTKVLISRDGCKDIILKESVGNFAETLYDSQNDNSDFHHCQKRVVVHDRVYVNVTAAANSLHQICFNAPHRIPYEGDDIALFTDPPRMSILVLKENCEELQEYLNQRNCSYNISDAKEWVPMTAEEKTKRQKWLYDNAMERANYSEFFNGV